MILICVEGGTKTQRDLGEVALRFFVKKLMPRKRSLRIELQIKNLLKDGFAGLCEHTDRNSVLIEAHNHGNLYDYISFLAHESIHMKQYVTGELILKGRKEIWQGKDCSGLSYKKQPWEIEAWQGQHKLAKEFIKNEIGITLKASKDLNPRSLKKMDWNAEHIFLDSVIAYQAKQRKRK